ncbi:MAG: hypothetical protein WCT02_00515 [Candidatus Paceibacterota bacterium]
MKFKYRLYGDSRRPVIPVIISNHGSYIQSEVLIDSGSDRCFFDQEIAEVLGIDQDHCTKQEVFGVGGKILSYYTYPVMMTVGGKSYSIEAGFMKFLGGGIVPYGFVGQKGFFENFIVRFDLRNNGIELEDTNRSK